MVIRCFAASVAILSLASLSCGGGGTTAPPLPQHGDVVVHVLIKTYVPKTVTIKAGQTVEWVWDDTVEAHDVVSGTYDGVETCIGDGKFPSTELLKRPAKFLQRFDRAGTYPYYCTPHCYFGMVGTVVVTP